MICQGQIYLSRVQGAKLFTMYLTRQIHKIMTQSQSYQNNEVEQEANEKLDKIVRVLRSLCATSQENVRFISTNNIHVMIEGIEY